MVKEEKNIAGSQAGSRTGELEAANLRNNWGQGTSFGIPNTRSH